MLQICRSALFIILALIYSPDQIVRYAAAEGRIDFTSGCVPLTHQEST